MMRRYLVTCLPVGLAFFGTSGCADVSHEQGGHGAEGQEAGDRSHGSQAGEEGSGGASGDAIQQSRAGGGGVAGKGTTGGRSLESGGGAAGSTSSTSHATTGGDGGAAGDPLKVTAGVGGKKAGGPGAGGKADGGASGIAQHGAGAGGVGAGGGGAGSSGLGGASGSAGATCSITIKTKSLSTAIPTVGIVEWSTDLSGMNEASIEFGLDSKYGMTAPVDLKEPNYRTLILGMKAEGKTYHFRVVAKAGDKICTGEDNTLPATGQVPNALPDVTLTPTTANGLQGGFLVLETFEQSFAATTSSGYAFIIDSDGDFVWWYPVKGAIDLSRAKQSYDGKSMWITNVNVMSNAPKVLRVKMDGTGEEDLSKEFGNTNHDLAVRSDETVAFIAYGANGCDEIKERSPSGTVSTILNSGTAVGASTCHCNAVQYDRNDDTIVFSELDTSSIVKVSRETKQVVWLMSSQNSAKATVTGVSWKNQHNFHIIDEKKFLFFSNNTGPNALAIEAEFSINGGKGTAKQVWSYPSTLTVPYMGDVQRLANGNTLITFSTAGEIREVSSGTLLQTVKLSGAKLVGFSEKRQSLYGPPPR